VTDAALLELYQAAWRDTSGDELAVARAIFEAGRLARPARRAKLPPARTAAEKREALHQAAVPFLRRRWSHLLEEAATRHRTTVVKMLAGARKRGRTAPAVVEACALLRDQADLGYEQIAAVLGIGTKTAWVAARRAGAKVETVRRLAA
jgi:hypothetical protein